MLECLVAGLEGSSTRPAFREFVHDSTGRAADSWLADHGAAIGKRSTVNLQSLLQASVWEPTSTPLPG
jgi:hypothetical protein